MRAVEIVTAIKDDHKEIKELYEEGLNKDLGYSEKKKIFASLSIIVTAHSKSEEAVVYAPTCGEEETKHEAFEGFEEHGLVELLMEEMKSEENKDRWEAKFAVVCDLLKHHVEEEETEYLPKLKKMFSDDERKEMGVEYREMYDRLIKAQMSISEPKEPAHLKSH